MLARGNTGQLTLSSLLYGVGLVLAAIILPFVPRLETVMLALLFGEVVGSVAVFWVTRHRTTAPIAVVLQQLVLSIGSTLAAAAVVYGSASYGLWIRFAILSAILLPVVGTQVLYGLAAPRLMRASRQRG
jgi:hypothetical protein